MSCVAGIVLAAGFSRRLGRPKQILCVAGETLVERAVRNAHEAGLSPILVVVNASVASETALADPLLKARCTMVLNEAAEEGLGASIRAGVGAALALSEVHGAVLMTCDQPGTTPEHLRRLYARPDRVTGSGYEGRIAVPAYLPRAKFAELMLLRGDTGARGLLLEAHTIEAPELALDIDTEADLQRARQRFE